MPVVFGPALRQIANNRAQEESDRPTPSGSEGSDDRPNSRSVGRSVTPGRVAVGAVIAAATALGLARYVRRRRRSTDPK